VLQCAQLPVLAITGSLSRPVTATLVRFQHVISITARPSTCLGRMGAGQPLVTATEPTCEWAAMRCVESESRWTVTLTFPTWLPVSIA
jgi:hypothetical protein